MFMHHPDISHLIGSPLADLWMVTSMLLMLSIVPQLPPTVPIFVRKQPKRRKLHKIHPTPKIQWNIMKSWKVISICHRNWGCDCSLMRFLLCDMATNNDSFGLLTEEMIRGLQQLGWKKVDVSFHSAFWPFFAHNNIHVLTLPNFSFGDVCSFGFL